MARERTAAFEHGRAEAPGGPRGVPAVLRAIGRRHSSMGRGEAPGRPRAAAWPPTVAYRPHDATHIARTTPRAGAWRPMAAYRPQDATHGRPRRRSRPAPSSLGGRGARRPQHRGGLRSAPWRSSVRLPPSCGPNRTLDRPRPSEAHASVASRAGLALAAAFADCGIEEGGINAVAIETHVGFDMQTQRAPRGRPRLGGVRAALAPGPRRSGTAASNGGGTEALAIETNVAHDMHAQRAPR
jgi:hypothetical protein